MKKPDNTRLAAAQSVLRNLFEQEESTAVRGLLAVASWRLQTIKFWC